MAVVTAAAYVNGRWACYSLEGRQRHYLGCSHERPRQAIAHTNVTYASPLRDSGVEPTPIQVPLAGVGPLGSTPEPLRSDSPVLDTGRR